MFFNKNNKLKTNGNGKEKCTNGHCNKKAAIQLKLDKALSEVEKISEETSCLKDELQIAEEEASGR